MWLHNSWNIVIISIETVCKAATQDYTLPAGWDRKARWVMEGKRPSMKHKSHGEGRDDGGGNHFRRKIVFDAVLTTGWNSRMKWPALQALFQGQCLDQVICWDSGANEAWDKEFFLCGLLVSQDISCRLTDTRSRLAPVCMMIDTVSKV